MARPGSKAAKKRDPRRPEDWPVSAYPYMITKPGAEHPTYHKDFAEAIRKLLGDVRGFRKQFRLLNSEDVLDCCDKAVETVKHLRPTGGSVDVVIDPHTGMRYRAELIRREEV